MYRSLRIISGFFLLAGIVSVAVASGRADPRELLARRRSYSRQTVAITATASIFPITKTASWRGRNKSMRTVESTVIKSS